jgi:release factor glutamine methyltransferase
MTWPERIVEAEKILKFNQLMKRREGGEPIAYIIGEREFWSLNLKVSSSTLIPRSDTERLVELALEKAVLVEGDILDLGTGTGAIALALASELPHRNIWGVDLKEEAQRLAQENAERLSINNARFLSGSWFEPLKHNAKYALIVSNPPYIESDDPHLSEGDVRFEPLSALVSADQGLADIQVIAKKAPKYLIEGGWLLFEHGFSQGEPVRTLLEKLGYDQVETFQDYGHRDRVTVGRFNTLE